MAIGAVLIALLSQMLFSGLHGAAVFSKRLNRDNDVSFAMNSMVDELMEADAIYKIQDHAIQFYVREKGRDGHKVVAYILEKDVLSRYGVHDHVKYDKERLNLKRGIRTVLLYKVEDMHFEQDGDALVIHMKCGKQRDRIVALRGRYE